MKDISFIKKSQNINLRSSKHYKFISELIFFLLKYNLCDIKN